MAAEGRCLVWNREATCSPWLSRGRWDPPPLDSYYVDSPDVEYQRVVTGIVNATENAGWSEFVLPSIPGQRPARGSDNRNKVLVRARTMLYGVPSPTQSDLTDLRQNLSSRALHHKTRPNLIQVAELRTEARLLLE